ncbi:hypothetical protein R80B4_02698 [Fibrobacteres bacterium R8-0-B4]
MNLYTAQRSHTGATAATADASRMRVKKQRTEQTPTESDRRGNVRTERARDKDRYDQGEAAYVVKTQMQRAPDERRYTPHPRVERNHQAESRRSSRA